MRINRKNFVIKILSKDKLKTFLCTKYDKKSTFVSIMENNITIFVEDENGNTAPLQAPTDMGLSLMELLKGNDYEVLATCGGMALCATCHVCVRKGFETLTAIGDDEYAMLDTLPNITDTSRLACQIRLNAAIDGLCVKIMGDGN